jgi:RimJ/RimL family protein N-acetyltransferase
MDLRDLRRAPAELLTPRLRLVRPALEHAAAVMDSVNASLDTLSFVSWGRQAFDLARAERFCTNNIGFVERGEALIYFVFERGGPGAGAFVGNLDLHHFDFTVPRCQIGYVGDARQAGRGLMHEAASALLGLGFELGLERIEAWCDSRNDRSIAFAASLGLVSEGVLRGVERDLQGQLCDQHLLAALKREWRPRNRFTRAA